LALPPKALKHVKGPVVNQALPTLAIPTLKKPERQQIPTLNVAPDQTSAITTAPIPPMKLKTPLLNLSLKPFEQTKYE
jgi:hypothetical protein